MKIHCFYLSTQFIRNSLWVYRFFATKQLVQWVHPHPHWELHSLARSRFLLPRLGNWRMERTAQLPFGIWVCLHKVILMTHDKLMINLINHQDWGKRGFLCSAKANSDKIQILQQLLSASISSILGGTSDSSWPIQFSSQTRACCDWCEPRVAAFWPFLGHYWPPSAGRPGRSENPPMYGGLHGFNHQETSKYKGVITE